MVGNNIANNSLGICLGYSSNNRISGNNIMANSWEGVRLVKSSYISVSGNVFTNNGLVVLDSYGNVVEDNLVNGKPLVYLEDASNLTIEDAGQVILINCDGITLENLNLTHTDKAIQLRNTNNTKITNNNITNNYDGILLSGSSYNSIAGNNITNNRYGISPFYSSNNAIYHNNFVDNAWQVDYWESVNVWDCGYLSGGNYWSDYTGVDLHNGQNQDLPGSDGIGDTEYVISMDNIDRYPLMAPFNTFEAGVWNGVAYSVDVVSNSTVSAFHFNPMEGPFLRFNVTGKDGTAGFCRITIPKDLLWVEDGWTITVGNQQITDYTIIPNENYTYLYFTYNHSTQTVTIQGTTVIPELPSTIILPTFMLLSTLATIFAKKKATKKKQN
jgi:parallel beta-helix repeat protein